MDIVDAWVFAGLAFFAGGLFGASLQLWFVNRDLDRIAARFGDKG